VPAADEILGLDLAEMGMEAYSDDPGPGEVAPVDQTETAV
jgi:hypothetical protein